MATTEERLALLEMKHNALSSSISAHISLRETFGQGNAEDEIEMLKRRVAVLEQQTKDLLSAIGDLQGKMSVVYTDEPSNT